MSFFTCVPPPPLPPPPRGPARCWRRRCPGVSRLRWDSTPPGRDTAPTRTSFSSPSPVEMEKKSGGQCWRDGMGRREGAGLFHTLRARERRLDRTDWISQANIPLHCRGGYEFTDRISFHDVSFGAADHHDYLGLEGDDQHRALVHHLPHCQLWSLNQQNTLNTCLRDICIKLQCLNNVLYKKKLNRGIYIIKENISVNIATTVVMSVVAVVEKLTSMLSMSRTLDWKSSPRALACWMGWASWLYVWQQEQEDETQPLCFQ